MILAFTTWIALGIAYMASAILCEQLAKRKGREEYIYFFIGLFLGPLGVLMAITPLPGELQENKPSAEERLKVVNGPRCPVCGRYSPPRSSECVYCGHDIEIPWWDRALYPRRGER